jgi:predicted alpha/beta-hydrolase family hydrolase
MSNSALFSRLGSFLEYFGNDFNKGYFSYGKNTENSAEGFSIFRVETEKERERERERERSESERERERARARARARDLLEDESEQDIIIEGISTTGRNIIV